MKGFTLKQIEQMKAEGKIRDFKVVNPTSKGDEPKGRIVVKHFKKIHPQKNRMAECLLWWSQEHGYILEEEYRFHGERKWRFDWVLYNRDPNEAPIRIAVEFEGIISEKSRHTTIKGYTGDTDKYREAAKLGWIVLRYTVLNYEQLIKDLNELL